MKYLFLDKGKIKNIKNSARYTKELAKASFKNKNDTDYDIDQFNNYGQDTSLNQDTLNVPDNSDNIDDALYGGSASTFDDSDLYSQAINTESQNNSSTIDDRDLYSDEDDLYKLPADGVYNNIFGFPKYMFDVDTQVTLKEARTSIEEKKSFIIDKHGSKKKSPEKNDYVYKTLPKMPIENQNVERLGFISASKEFKLTRIKKPKHYKGVIQNEILITSNKKFNNKKIGYLPITRENNTYNNPNETKYYVEVTEDRGCKWLIILLIIIIAIMLFFGTRDYQNWHFDKNWLTVYKTKEVTEYINSELQISLNATPVLRDGVVNINLTSDSNDGITYIAKLYDNDNNLLYESSEMEAGEGLNNISLDKIPDNELTECTLICDSYRNGNYIGSVESTLELKVKAGN
jgi:hypothetical protein